MNWNRLTGGLLALVAAVAFVLALALLPDVVGPRVVRETVGVGKGRRAVEIVDALIEDSGAKMDEKRDLVVRGVVTSEDGVPIEGCVLALLGHGERTAELPSLVESARCVTSGKDGSFLLDWPTGKRAGGWRLVARHDYFQPAGIDLSHDTAESGDPLKIVLSRGLTITGRVLMGQNRQPVAGVRVVARGTHASLETDRAMRFADDRASVSSAVSGADGRYEIRGLRTGWYRLRPAGRGLALVTRARGDEPTFRGLVVRAGEAARDMVAFAVGTAQVGFVDAATGDRVSVSQSTISFGGGRPGSSDVFPAQNIVGDGRFAGRASHDEIVLQFISPEWPIPPDWTTTGTIDLPGYGKQRVEVHLRPVGDPSAAAPQLFTVKASSAVGRCRFMLRDAAGRPVGPAVRWLSLVPRGIGATQSVPVTFDSAGRGRPITLPTGTYSVEPVDASFSGFQRSEDLVVASSGMTERELRLDAGAILVDVIDDSGAAIDGVGLRWGEGHQPISMRLNESGTAPRRGAAVAGARNRVVERARRRFARCGTWKGSSPSRRAVPATAPRARISRSCAAKSPGSRS